VSQFAALLFLAVWHGLHSGYYMCFFMEFLVMKLEKDVRRTCFHGGSFCHAKLKKFRLFYLSVGEDPGEERQDSTLAFPSRLFLD